MLPKPWSFRPALKLFASVHPVHPVRPSLYPQMTQRSADSEKSHRWNLWKKTKFQSPIVRQLVRLVQIFPSRKEQPRCRYSQQEATCAVPVDKWHRVAAGAHGVTRPTLPAMLPLDFRLSPFELTAAESSQASREAGCKRIPHPRFEFRVSPSIQPILLILFRAFDTNDSLAPLARP